MSGPSPLVCLAVAHDDQHMSLQHVSVGIDQSDVSVTALRWAADLAATCDASVEVVHAWQLPLLSYAPESMGPLPTAETMVELAREVAEKTLAEAGVSDASVLIKEGVAGKVMVQQCGPDRLVVLGRTGHGFRSIVGRIVDGLLGSTARHVLHHGTGPVAVIEPDSVWADEPRVLVGVDGSTSSLAALRWAIEALPEPATIEARQYVIPWVDDPLVPVDASFTPTLLARAEDELVEAVATTVAESTRPEREVVCTVMTGAPSWALSRAADDFDLVVVGHRDRSVLATKLLGSVAEHAVRHARVPVVVVPEI